MTISPDAFGRLFDDFQQEAFRLETLDDYSKSGNVDAYQAFLAGESQPPGYNARWLAQVRRNTDAGRRMYRVHILTRPLTRYLQFELGWGYLTNATAGEEFFILDITEKSNPLDGVPDFWMFDESATVSMTYDDEGRFLGAEEEPDVQKWIHWRDTALSHAEPFADWWERHGS
ncbi:DUF6879 family protein [Kitasatospora sp. A2-31]|uniref:DUF6879 family protein n=1 Tax=Kitasatospora sp. A2-31 TaxID=2916414 RepID=UPI001EED35C8|nr:DUF6879 family protein [Kitasatospora sp. A2-31]MCG6499120.1 hypothetical protein [Kitasatospora sp. A2-31]MCG6500171.1 hypothetical protein [Kitasatospora sp. A2-31]